MVIQILVLPHAGEKHAVFHVKTYKNTPDYENGLAMPCLEIKFLYQDFTDENTPLLVVYSYDKKIENISYKQTVETMITTQELPTPSLAQSRKKRSIPTCQVNNLTIPGANIYKYMEGVDSENIAVLYPSTFNAGICGGACTGTQPENTALHATFLFQFLGDPDSSPTHGYDLIKCCTPVKYDPLQVLLRMDGVVEINIIDGMKVSACECLDIVDFHVSK